MAVYWIDPHTTVNGTGTYASPYSFNAATNITSLVAGDEIRIKGVALSSLLTATTYTATVASNGHQLTVTAGGGLGADFPANTVVYIPDYDTFFKVQTQTGNVIGYNGANQHILPIFDSTKFNGTTSITIRKVNTATYGVSSASSYWMWGNITGLDGVSVSDCWVDATTRVTDGTVKSILNCSSTTGTIFYVAGSATSVPSKNCTIDLPNTHVLPSNALTTTASVELGVRSTGSTITINQIENAYFSSGGIRIGAGTYPHAANTITVDKMGGNGILSIYGKNNTLTLNRLYNRYVSYCLVSNTRLGFAYAYGTTVNIGDVIAQGQSGNSILPILDCAPITINFNGQVELVDTTAISSFYEGFGPATINFGSSFAIWRNKKAIQQTTLPYLNYYSSGGMYGGKVYVPDIPTPPTITAFTLARNYFGTVGTTNTNVGVSKYQKGVTLVDFPAASDFNSSYMNNQSEVGNILCTFRDGSSPIEVLSIAGLGYSSTTTVSRFPIVTLDASTFRTAGPSLKCNLNTYAFAYWYQSGSALQARSVKTIKIPCIAGQSYTVTGYIRNAVTSFANGDVRMAIAYKDVELVGQNMTTASNGAWEQFSLTFTAAETGEYLLAMDMFFANAGSVWLDDLAII